MELAGEEREEEGEEGTLQEKEEKRKKKKLSERERMMGFEPTTFCMASRRSSQLSYIRMEGEV